MKTILIFTLIFLTFACSETEEKPKEKKIETLVEVKDGIFTEYYPGKKSIKFQGAQDGNGLRQGKWVFYAENGNELSITHFNHGMKDGHSIVKYPTGAMHYFGEYKNDVKVGIWKTYDAKSQLLEEKDFGGL
ncbi:MAG: hypothetical protein V4622_14710 [Bacteroidota bacterium]